MPASTRSKGRASGVTLTVSDSTSRTSDANVGSSRPRHGTDGAPKDRKRTAGSSSSASEGPSTSSDPQLFTAHCVESQPFPYDLPLAHLDLHEHSYLYRPAKGEQGIFHVQPYKDILLPLWSFKDEARARQSSQSIFSLFEKYKKEENFVGCDMARKFIQMGFTRSRRYANNPAGRKYAAPSGDGSKKRKALSNSNNKGVSLTADQQLKARCAEYFANKLQRIRDDADYEHLKRRWAQWVAEQLNKDDDDGRRARLAVDSSGKTRGKSKVKAEEETRSERIAQLILACKELGVWKQDREKVSERR